MRFRPPIVARLGLCLLAGILTTSAATKTWTGKQNGLWSNPTNWLGNVAPVHLDSLEFPGDAKIRTMVNDLSGLEFGAFTFTGGGYVLQGNKLYMKGDITSIPGNTTNQIECAIFVGAPMTITCFGYSNQLVLLGGFQVKYPLRLVTGSSIYLGYYLLISSGSLYITPDEPTIVEYGTLELLYPADSKGFGGTVVVGGEQESGLTARVRSWATNQFSDNTTFILNKTGILDLNGFDQRVGTLSGTGVALLRSNKLTVASPAEGSTFSGELRGTGTFRVEGATNGFELGGHNTFTGRVEVAALPTVNYPGYISETRSHLRFTGSASNAVVIVSEESILSGYGVAKGLAATNATIRPGPGPLRFLQNCKLDEASSLEIQLGGTDASMIQAGTIDLGGASLQVSYQGVDPENLFTLVAANNAAAGSSFQGLPEGAWLLAGEQSNLSEFQLTYQGNGGQDVVLERTGLFLPPTLRIRQLSATERIIEWPLAALGYSLQYAPTLDAGDWISNGLSPPATNTTDHFVIDAPSGVHRFYRLIR